MNRTAGFSECGVYRYWLGRSWGDGPRAVFVMLNPSTADDNKDDPTIRRCIRFAKDWGYDGLTVLNLFAIRSTDPRTLFSTHLDPIGPANDVAILEATRYAGVIVAAWGVHGGFRGRGTAVRNSLERRGLQLFSLGVTRSGHPKHPLYVPAATTRQLYGGDRLNAIPRPA